jgi:exonuclease SbcD
MRVLHTSDWHLGRVLFDHPLLADQRRMLEQVVGHCAGGGYDAVLVSGDLFDRSLASEAAVRLWSEFLRDFRAACPRLPLVAIAGNHDSAARIAYAADALALAGIHVRGGAEGLERPVELRGDGGGRIQVWPVPFLWAGDLDAGADGEGQPVRTQAETLALALERIRPGQDPAAAQVLMAHCFARGGAPSDSERVLVGTVTEVEPELFDGFHYVALGHLHRCQRIRDRVWYSGSPLPYSFSEARDAKALLAVDLDPDGPPRVERLPLVVPRPLRRLAGTLAELLDDPRFQADAECLVEITLPAGEAGANPFQLLKQRFPYLCCLGYAPAAGAGPADPGAAGALRRDGDLLSDFRQFAEDIGLEPGARDGRAALVDRLVQELARQEQP